MKEHPILFNSEMVRAILDSRKTQTRRVIKPQCEANLMSGYQEWEYEGLLARCPFGQIGDRLWVRETWRQPEDFEGYDRGAVLYAVSEMDAGAKWKPSIHMPRWASRITLEITDIRVERLQDITLLNCIKEGIEKKKGSWGIIHFEFNKKQSDSPRDLFKDLWNSMNKKHTWDSNHYVWAIEFRRVI